MVPDIEPNIDKTLDLPDKLKILGKKKGAMPRFFYVHVTKP
jgi:hypothetical protein